MTKFKTDIARREKDGVDNFWIADVDDAVKEEVNNIGYCGGAMEKTSQEKIAKLTDLVGELYLVLDRAGLLDDQAVDYLKPYSWEIVK